jgi:hypothetical protein
MSIVLHSHWRSLAAYRARMVLNVPALDDRRVICNPRTGAYRQPAHHTLSAIAFPTLGCTLALAPSALVHREMQTYADAVA